MYTLLVWATERDGKFDPRGVRDLAMKRMKMIRANPELAAEYDF